MIRDVAELRERGQVQRRVAELDVDVDTWRAAMRRAARREGMRIRTFVVDPADNAVDDDQHDGMTAATSPEVLVFAVRTDRPPTDPAVLAAAVNQLPAPPGFGSDRSSASPASVTSLTAERARRVGHPCADPPERA